MSQETINSNSERNKARWKGFAIGAAIVALAGVNIYQLSQIGGLRDELSTVGQNLATSEHQQRESRLTLDMANQDLNALRQELEAARAQASKAAGQARVEAQKHADKLAKQLVEQQQMQHELMTAEVQAARDALSETSERVSEVSSEVGKVEGEVQRTRADLDRTLADLVSVRGDMGVMSGLIATNATELTALKELGERNYFEFRVEKNNVLHKIGDIRVQVRKVDTKRNKFTVDVHVDDKRIEKKDKTLNEPIQFYVLGHRQPWELVVFEVNKNEIAGYLATPKTQLAQSRPQLN